MFQVELKKNEAAQFPLPPPPPAADFPLPPPPPAVIPSEVVPLRAAAVSLPPPPAVFPLDVVPFRVTPEVTKNKGIEGKQKLRQPMARRGLGTKGQKISLLTNHFSVKVHKTEGDFYHYSVAISYEDGHEVETKGIGRSVLDKVYETYSAELDGKYFAYDGEKSLFTFRSLPRKKFDFLVVLEDTSYRSAGGDSPEDYSRKRVRRQQRSKTYKVDITYAGKIPMQAIASALRGEESNNSREALRVLDIILRQHAYKQGCLLVRQSFFKDDVRNHLTIGGGVIGCRGFHSSFRVTQGGLSLNTDVSTTMIVKPGPVVDFLLDNQNARDPSLIEWGKAKRALKNLRVRTKPTNKEQKISGVSDVPCKKLMFTLRKKNGLGENIETEISVYDYFVNHRKIALHYSGDLPCINVGNPKHPVYVPLELCDLVPLQRYTKALTNLQRASLVEKSRQKPMERMDVLSKALKNSNYDDNPMLHSCGISINTNFSQVEGRILQAPKLKVGGGDTFFPRGGRWNFNNKRFVEPVTIGVWAVVNFSARCDTRSLVPDIRRCGAMKGIVIPPPFNVFEENPQFRRAPPAVRVDEMFKFMSSKLKKAPQFLLCILPERKNCALYGPLKKKSLTECGVVTQCMAPTKVNDQYLTNLLLKINAKLGGLNSLLCIENTPAIPAISKVPTIILGMDVSHGSPGQSDIPSIAAVVGSRQWPFISRYRASVRTQSPKVEMIDSLFQKVSEKDDNGIIRELMVEFYKSSKQRKPEHVIIFRDGVSESQFNQVLNIELSQIIEACKFLDDRWNPKFTVIIAQKNHHTKFFQPNSPQNVPPGTIIDNRVCHPKTNDFYLCAHAGMIGTTRPVHYHILFDEIGFSTDDLQELVHSLSYVYQRSTTAVSLVAPVCYAHLAAAQMANFVKLSDSGGVSSRDRATQVGPVPIWAGNPAKFLRKLTAEELTSISQSAINYTNLAQVHAVENAKSSDEIEEEKELRKKFTNRDEDYESMVGVVREIPPQLILPDNILKGNLSKSA